jgi:hypothetical protein
LRIFIGAIADLQRSDFSREAASTHRMRKRSMLNGLSRLQPDESRPEFWNEALIAWLDQNRTGGEPNVS